MTAREYAIDLEAVLRIGREQGILKAVSANELIPESRLAWIASATATLYIQRGKGGGAGATAEPARTGSTPGAAAPTKTPMPSKYPGKCWRCLKGYPVGEPILSEKVDGVTKWGHEACVRNPK